MPHLRVELTGPLEPALKRRLLAETAGELSAVTGSPIDRVRTQVLEYPADGMAVGGVPVSESGRVSPLVWVHLLAGRPAEVRLQLIDRLSTVVAAILAVPLSDVRVFVTEFAPDRWGIGGRPRAWPAD